MRGKIYTDEDKEKVKNLIVAGKSYNEITKLIGVPKSTISTWFGGKLKKPLNKKALKEHLARARKKASVSISKKWELWRNNEDLVAQQNVRAEISRYPFNNIGFYKSMLAMLYWAEGSRHGNISGLKFANTDPKLSALYINLLRRCYTIKEAKLRVRLHLHYYHSIKKSKSFWSEVLKIPQNQFTKTYIKKRSKTKKFRQNFAGICFISYGDSSIRREIMALCEELQKTISSNKNVPVA